MPQLTPAASETEGPTLVTHLLVDQLRFARSEFARSLTGVSDEDARHRLGPMNCLSWQGYPLVARPVSPESIGTMLLRMIGHYWFHTGEAQAVRQLLGHRNLPDFVGDIGQKAPYRSEAS